MIFQHTWQKVLSGEKTQTRRIVKGNDELSRPRIDGLTRVAFIAHFPRYITAVERNNHLLYQVGKTYAVQPGRGQPAVTRIRLTAIGREDVREISLEDAKDEGFTNQMEFWYTWVQMYDPKGCGPYLKESLPIEIRKHLFTRPDNRYQAWVLTFEVVQA